MLKNFLNKPNALWQVFIVLLVAGGLAFAGMYDGFVVETEVQKSCCGGSTDAIRSDGTIAQLKTGSCCGSKETDVPSVGSDAPGFAAEDPCECLTTESCGSTSCSNCETVTECDTGCTCNTCSAHCKNQDSDSTMCGDGSGCTDGRTE